MIIEKFSGRCQDALERASRLAVKASHKNITPWHLLSGLMAQDQSPAMTYLTDAGVDAKALAVTVESRLHAQERAPAGVQQTPISRALEKVFIHAEETASLASDKYIGVAHMMLGLLEDADVAAAFTEHGADTAKLARVLRDAPKGGYGGAESADTDFEYLNQYAEDLTAIAHRGGLDPVIGRNSEVDLTIEILSRRRKNNPIVIGEPGVGKTAIVESLAQRIAAGTVHDDLKKMKLLSLDLGRVIAGARYRGEFEERLKHILEEVKGAGNIILFIDEIHMLIGAGASEGSMDAANLLKPSLARGELRCIGATTLEEYRKRIEKDAALMRRFQLVMADEPSVTETVSMLRGVKEKYELHHGVRIMDDAIAAAVRLSKRYLSDRFLPDKAFDLLDQTAASLRLALSSKPSELQELDHKIVELEIESHALEQEPSAKAQERLQAVKAELAECRARSEELTTRWQRERDAIDKVREAQQRLDAALHEKEAKIAAEDFAGVAELEYKVIPECERILAEYADIDVAESSMLDSVVSETKVADTVARVTGIPVSSMLGDERERLLGLEDHLRKRVVGQEDALSVVAKAVRRARAGVQTPTRPIASFLMLGPTGVGKTELAKTLAEFLFHDEHALLRIDMSEYMEKHAAAMLVGAPPGYVGYEEGGVLTNRVRRKPYSVVLFDEVEKGHSDVYNLFLQLLDDGRLTDTHGTTVDFTNTIVLMTSNLGAEHIRPTETPEEYSEMVGDIMGSVRAKFRPELLNRLDDILMFRPLTMDAMKPITDIQLRRLDGLLRDREIELTVDDDARTLLAEAGYNPIFGARPLQRVIQTMLRDPLAEKIIEGGLGAGARVTVSVADGALDIRTEPGASDA